MTRRQLLLGAGAALTPDEYAATLSEDQRRYRAMYMQIFKSRGCKGYCVAGSGGREPRSGRCPFCGAA